MVDVQLYQFGNPNSNLDEGAGVLQVSHQHCSVHAVVFPVILLLQLQEHTCRAVARTCNCLEALSSGEVCLFVNESGTFFGDGSEFYQLLVLDFPLVTAFEGIHLYPCSIGSGKGVW